MAVNTNTSFCPLFPQPIECLSHLPPGSMHLALQCKATVAATSPNLGPFYCINGSSGITSGLIRTQSCQGDHRILLTWVLTTVTHLCECTPRKIQDALLHFYSKVHISGWFMTYFLKWAYCSLCLGCIEAVGGSLHHRLHFKGRWSNYRCRNQRRWRGEKQVLHGITEHQDCAVLSLG